MIKIPTYWVEPTLTGYQPVTTYWTQLNAIEANNAASEDAACIAIRKWLTSILKEAQNNYKAYTELVMVLNHRCWAHANRQQNKIGKLYSDLFYKTQGWGYNNLKGEQLSYFINTLD